MTATTLERIDKARRLLIEGRLTVRHVLHLEDEGYLIVADCKGDSGEVYDLSHNPLAKTPWACTCPARTTCSHLKALQLVTVRRG